MNIFNWPATTNSSQIKNLSGVVGATVTAALNTLSAGVGALTSTNIANASGVAGATVTAALNTLAAAIAALTTTAITNASGVAGATATAALNTLAAAITAVSATVAALTSTSIANASSATGATVTAALNALLALCTAQRDAFWDPPTTPSANDQEFNVDVLASGAWNIGLVGSPGTPMTRDGAFDLTQAIASGHYRSSVKGGVLLVQIRQNEEILIWKQVAAALSSHLLWMLGVSYQTEVGTANTTDPRASLQICRQTGSVPDLTNRVLIRTASSNDRYEVINVTAGVPTTVGTNTLQLATLDALALRVNHGSAAANNCSGFGYTRQGTITTIGTVSGLQMNNSTDKIVINLQANTATPVISGTNNAVFVLKFLRTVDLAAGGWLAQN